MATKREYAHEAISRMIPPQQDELHRIAVPWDVARTNQNRRFGHWGQAASEMAEGQRLGLYFWRIDRFQTNERILVQYWVLRGRKLDPTNAAAGVKPIEDGIFRRNWHRSSWCPDGEGVTPDDSEEYLEVEFVRQIVIPSFAKNEWVVCVIKRHPDQKESYRGKSEVSAPDPQEPGRLCQVAGE